MILKILDKDEILSLNFNDYLYARKLDISISAFEIFALI